MPEYERQRHPIAPLFSARSRVLILGSFPSVKSREAAFFYGHPQNRFWRVLAAVFDEPVPQTVEEKTGLVLRNRLALWDVIAECDIAGSSDSSIRNVRPNDLSMILQNSAVRRIFVNGTTAARLYDRYLLPVTAIPAQRLPSTSPANAGWSRERLVQAWQVLKEE